MFRVDGPVNLVRLNQLVDLLTQPKLRWPAVRAGLAARSSRTAPTSSKRCSRATSCCTIRSKASSRSIEFLRQAAVDPTCCAIRMTIYRTGISSVMVDLLEEAARRGKEVTVIVELKARFDEEANINWAERLEAVGAQVVYGVVGLKTHGKLPLVPRREEFAAGSGSCRYAHLGTGNYHTRTTKLYTDFGMLTARAGYLRATWRRSFLHLTSLTEGRATEGSCGWRRSRCTGTC